MHKTDIIERKHPEEALRGEATSELAEWPGTESSLRPTVTVDDSVGLGLADSQYLADLEEPSQVERKLLEGFNTSLSQKGVLQ